MRAERLSMTLPDSKRLVPRCCHDTACYRWFRQEPDLPSEEPDTVTENVLFAHDADEPCNYAQDTTTWD